MLVSLARHRQGVFELERDVEVELGDLVAGVYHEPIAVELGTRTRSFGVVKRGAHAVPRRR